MRVHYDVLKGNDTMFQSLSTMDYNFTIKEEYSLGRLGLTQESNNYAISKLLYNFNYILVILAMIILFVGLFIK